MKKLLAKTRKIVERDATDHAIFFRGFTSKMLQIFKHCRIAPSYSDSAKNRIMGIRPEPIRGKMTDTICPRPFSQEFGRQSRVAFWRA